MSLSAFQERKITKHFRILDANGNGVLEKKDFEILAERVCALRQSTPELAKATTESILRIFTLLGKETVTLAEWMEQMKAILSKPEMIEQEMKPVANALFDWADADKDNTITEVEYVQLLMVVGVSERDAKLSFSMLDRDHDGIIGRGEFLKDVVDFYTSQEPNAPGNWLFGPISEYQLSPFQLKKVVKHFRTLDVNGNGILEKKDFDIIATRLCAQHSATPEAEKSVRDSLDLLFRITNKPTATLEECISQMEIFLSTKEGIQQHVLAIAKSLFDLADVDKDNTITLSEYLNLWLPFGFPEQIIKFVFSKLDLDHNGTISREEFLKDTIEFYTSEDPSAPGNWLFGPLD